MKRRFTKLMAALALLTFLAVPLGMWGQTTIFSETFGETNSNTAYASYSGYTATTNMFVGNGTVASHYSGTGKVGKSTVVPSTGYTGASGNSAAWYQAATGNNVSNALVISGINISGYTDLGISFGMYRTNGSSSTNVTSVTYSIDGGTAHSLSFTQPTSSETWTLINGSLSGTGNSLTITFTMTTSGGYTSRYDDIVVTGTASTPTITISDEQLILPYEENDNGTFSVSYTNFTPVYATAALYYDEECSQAFPTSGPDAWILLDLDQYVDPYDAIPFMVEENEAPNSRPVYMKVEAMDDGSNVIEGVFTITQEGKPAPVPYINIVANHGETVENPYLIERPTWQNGGGFLREVEFGNFTVSGASDFQILYCNANGEPIDETPAMFSGVQVDYYYYQYYQTYVYRLYVAVTNNNSTQDRSGYFKVWANNNNNPVYSGLVTVHQPGKPQVATPTFNPAAGAVPAGTEVAISCTTEGAAIQYSTDGTNYSEYTAPIVINEAMTLYAKATAEGYVDSEVATAQYTVKGDAVFENGVYSEPMTTQASFNNMEVVNVTGDGTWVYNSTYSCAFIKQSDAQEDWLITPRMAVDNGKLLVSFQIYHKNLEQNGIALKWSTSNSTSGTWQDVEFDKGNASGWRNVNDLVIETGDAENIYLAFVYKNVNTANAQCQIRNLTVRQYYNVTFDANDLSATGTMDDLACVAGVATALTANNYTVEGRVFDGWNTQPDGQGTTYADGDDITITANTILYAQWLDTYKVKFTTNGIEDGTMQVVQGQAIGTLPTASPEYIPADYVFMGWLASEYQVSDEAPNAYIGTDFVPQGDVTLYAVFAKVSGSAASLTKMTSNDTFAVGDNVVIVAEGNVAMYQQTTNTSYVNKYTFDNNVLTVAADDKNWFTVSAGNSGTWKLGDATNGYVYNSSSNDLKVDTQNATEFNLAWNNDNSKFTLEGNSRWLSYRSDLANKYFRMGGASTGSGSGVIYFDIYKYVAGSASYSNYRTSLTATSYLTINGYSSDDIKDGYYLIASPVYVDPATVEGMTSGDFDLYYFDEVQDHEEWRNYEAGNFTFVPGTGYLYAKKATAATPTYNFTLEGAPYNGNGQVTLQKAEGTQFSGWNLIGNPYANPATLGTTAFYKMNSTGSELESVDVGTTIDAMEGVFVLAANDGDVVTFEEQIPNEPNSGNAVSQLSININKSRGESIDRAIVRFDNGNQLPKFQLNPKHTKVYFQQDNKDYAVVRSANEGEMPVSFKAETRGTYTLSVNAENVEMNYLHLIDNMTGADVDLLVTPSYTFEAKTSDYASRFRLVFSASSISEDADGDNAFAYFNGSSWTVSNMGEATLQVVDVMGRVLSSEQISGNAEVNINQPTGVYMLRLLNENNVRVQKIVVR